MDINSKKNIPATIDVRTVIQMMHNLKTDLLSEIKRSTAQRIDSEMVKINSRIQVCEAKEDMIVRTMSGIHDITKEVQTKAENIEVNQAKRTVILANFEGDAKINICRKKINEFFHTVMGIEIQVEEVYHIGDNTPRDVVIVLSCIEHKRKIFQNIGRIKNTTNCHGKKYRFRDFYTTKQNEIRKKPAILANVVNDGTDNPENVVTVDKGEIFVGEDKYSQRIQPPDPTKIFAAIITQAE